MVLVQRRIGGTGVAVACEAVPARSQGARAGFRFYTAPPPRGLRENGLAPFHAQIVFADQDQFGRPFQEVAAAGMRTGAHGLMIENVDTFIVEIFEELP
jgi:hypothetical protein